MAYFRNNAINLLNLHAALYSLAANSSGIFVAVYLLKAGLSVPTVLSAMGLIMTGRFVARLPIVAAARLLGLRPLVIFGTAGTAVQYALVAFVHGLNSALLAYCVVSAVADAFYWTAFHAYFAAFGDDEARGRQTSLREALSAIVAIVAPLAGGWLLTRFGAGATFGAAATVQAAAALPFLAVRNISVAREAEGTTRAARTGILLGAAGGWMLATFVLAWQLLLFLTLSRSFLAFGGAMAVAAIAGAATGLALGRMTDFGRGTRAVTIAFACMATTVLVRLLSISEPTLAVAATALGTFALCVDAPTGQAPFYNVAKAAPCTLRFFVATEGAADVGFASACFLVASLVSLGFPLSSSVLLSFAGPLMSFVVLRRYYAKDAAGAPAVQAPQDSTSRRST
jgi:hypothetical protein